MFVISALHYLRCNIHVVTPKTYVTFITATKLAEDLDFFLFVKKKRLCLINHLSILYKSSQEWKFRAHHTSLACF